MNIRWYIIKLLGSLALLAATVYMVYQMAMKQPMILPVVLFVIVLISYLAICWKVRKEMEVEAERAKEKMYQSAKGKESRDGR